MEAFVGGTTRFRALLLNTEAMLSVGARQKRWCGTEAAGCLVLVL